MYIYIYTWYISGTYCQMGDCILPTTYYQNLKIHSKKHGSVVMSHVTKIYRNGWQLQRFFCIRSNNRFFWRGLGEEKSHPENHWGSINDIKFSKSNLSIQTFIGYKNDFHSISKEGLSLVERWCQKRALLQPATWSHKERKGHFVGWKKNTGPGDSKWPFDPSVGAHLTLGHLTIPKWAQRIAREFVVWHFKKKNPFETHCFRQVFFSEIVPSNLFLKIRSNQKNNPESLCEATASSIPNGELLKFWSFRIPSLPNTFWKCGPKKIGQGPQK